MGGRCLEAAALLAPLGYDVRPLAQGYPDLVEAGFPSVKGK
jgi:rhodanese-related sulfurtransferase